MNTNPIYARLKANLTQPIILVGMMGTGKTALARGLARNMGQEAVDIDAKIVKRAGLSIPEIFERHGEETFRRLEHDVLEEVLSTAQSKGHYPVIATGGGILTNPKCAALIQERGISVWLKADLDALAERLSQDKNRPMLSGAENVRARLEELMTTREPLYAASDITFATHNAPLYKTVHKLAETVLKHIQVKNT